MTTPAPTLQTVTAYLAVDGLPDAYAAADIEGAFRAERAAQRSVCKVPAEGEWPADLAEALNRRVQHNLALRKLPLGLQANVTEAAVAQTRVGGTDAEVRRLEGPYRKRVVG